jgi:predicted ribosome quality control (RQC) complex YloA/Tae2 family protein
MSVRIYGGNKQKKKKNTVGVTSDFFKIMYGWNACENEYIVGIYSV